MRAQVSLEYLIIVMFTFVILLPTVYFLSHLSQSAGASVTAAQYYRIGNTVLTSALEVRAQGAGSWRTVELSFPESVVDVTIGLAGDELIIEYDSIYGLSRALFFSDIPLSADPAPLPFDGTIFQNAPHAGLTTLRLVALDGGVVHISEVV